MVPAAVLFVFAVGCVCGAAAERKLVYVTVLFRHGDRSPVKAYPTDPHQESDWPQGFGQLSQIGMQQHFELGQFLRDRYKTLLNESYDRHEILVRSTDYDRTLMSAEANLAGLYPPSGQQVFKPDLKWQPIPVHTVPQSEERLLSFPLKDCPRYQQLMNETEHTEEFLNVTATYQDIIELVRNKTGLNHTTVETVWGVYDTLFCESLHNMPVPDWASPDVMKKLQKLKDFGFQVIFGVYNQQEKSRLQGALRLITLELIEALVKSYGNVGYRRPLKVHILDAHLNNFKEIIGAHSEEQGERFHPYIMSFKNRYQRSFNETMMSDCIWGLIRESMLLGEIVKNLSRMAIPDPQRRLKMMMLSAHDTTVTALQASLSVFNGIQPPYASCHMIELYRDDNGAASVSMFYRNDSKVKPYPLQLPGCSLDCPLDEFVRITKLSISEDRDKECQLPSKGTDKQVIASLAVAGCLLLLLVVLLLGFLCRYKEPMSNRGYQHVINRDVGEYS